MSWDSTTLLVGDNPAVDVFVSEADAQRVTASPRGQHHER
jgi:hypothetical protein